MDHMGFVMRIYPDGRSNLIYPVTGEVLSEAEYTVEGDQVILIEYDLCPGVEGLYKWAQDGDQLIFELIEDNCENRVKGLSKPLTRYEPEE